MLLADFFPGKFMLAHVSLHCFPYRRLLGNMCNSKRNRVRKCADTPLFLSFAQIQIGSFGLCQQYSGTPQAVSGCSLGVSSGSWFDAGQTPWKSLPHSALPQLSWGEKNGMNSSWVEIRLGRKHSEGEGDSS